MKANLDQKSLNGSISLRISPGDPVAWKLLMLFDAASHTHDKIEDIAKKYGYTREHFYVIKKAFEKEGSKALLDKPQGPKRNYRLTKEIEKQIIRHRFLDPEASSEVIAQKMQQAGYVISQRSVERAINEWGLQKKGYIKQIRKTRNLK
jgi:transposase